MLQMENRLSRKTFSLEIQPRYTYRTLTLKIYSGAKVGGRGQRVGTSKIKKEDCDCRKPRKKFHEWMRFEGPGRGSSESRGRLFCPHPFSRKKGGCVK